MLLISPLQMAGPRWNEAYSALAELSRIASQYDLDGVDLHFLNDTRCALGVRDVTQVQQLFDDIRPNGPTPTATKLEELLLIYLKKLEEAQDLDEKGIGYQGRSHVKPVNFIVITDGEPSE